MNSTLPQRIARWTETLDKLEGDIHYLICRKISDVALQQEIEKMLQLLHSLPEASSTTELETLEAAYRNERYWTAGQNRAAFAYDFAHVGRAILFEAEANAE
jgi:hypothetical protein